MSVEKDFIKKNFLRFAKYHKEHCNVGECGITLYAFRLALEKLEIPLTDEETRLLL